MPKSSKSILPIGFDAYEVHGVKKYEESGSKFCEQVSDNEADFWSLYGHIPGQGLSCIGDFRTREYAEEIYARITGHSYTNGSDALPIPACPFGKIV